MRCPTSLRRTAESCKPSRKPRTAGPAFLLLFRLSLVSETDAGEESGGAGNAISAASTSAHSLSSSLSRQRQSTKSKYGEGFNGQLRREPRATVGRLRPKKLRNMRARLSSTACMSVRMCVHVGRTSQYLNLVGVLYSDTHLARAVTAWGNPPQRWASSVARRKSHQVHENEPPKPPQTSRTSLFGRPRREDLPNSKQSARFVSMILGICCLKPFLQQAHC